MSLNIKFNYLYRDAANYKIFGWTIFSNPNELALEKIEQVIKEKLIDGEFFEYFKFDLPNLHFEKYDHELVHNLYEFESIELTDEDQNDSISINNFLQIFNKC